MKNSGISLPVWLNSSPKKLTRPVIIEWKKCDPTTGYLFSRYSIFTVKPTETPGISFRVGDIVIPYDSHHLFGVDTKLGRMLCLRHPDHNIQIILVEHLLSALNLLGLNNIQVVMDNSARWRLTSTNAPVLGLWMPTYWVPVVWPGVSGFIDALEPYCEETWKAPEILRITQERTHTAVDANPRYWRIERRLTIKPADRLIIRILSAKQPDIKNCPEPEPIVIAEDDDVRDFLSARPIMRIRNFTEEMIVFLLNLSGSSMLTHDTYVKSRPWLTPEEIVARMFPQFQWGRHEFLYHAGLADRTWEIGSFTPEWQHIHGEFIMENMNHVAHMLALRALLTPDMLWK